MLSITIKAFGDAESNKYIHIQIQKFSKLKREYTYRNFILKQFERRTMDNELSLSRFLDEKYDEIINFMNKALEWQIVSEVGYPTNLDGRTFLIEYFVDFNKSAPVTTSYYVTGCDSNGFFWLENEYYGEYFKEGQVYAWKEIK